MVQEKGKGLWPAHPVLFRPFILPQGEDSSHSSPTPVWVTHGVTSPASKPAPVWSSSFHGFTGPARSLLHRVTASLRHIHCFSIRSSMGYREISPVVPEHLLPLRLCWYWCLQGCLSHIFSFPSPAAIALAQWFLPPFLTVICWSCYHRCLGWC